MPQPDSWGLWYIEATMIEDIPTALNRLNGVNVPLSEFTPSVYQALRDKGLVCTFTHTKGIMIRLAQQKTRREIKQHKTIATLTTWQGPPAPEKPKVIEIKPPRICGVYAVVNALADGPREVAVFRQDSLNAARRRGWVDRYYGEECYMARLTESGQAILAAIRLAPLK